MGEGIPGQLPGVPQLPQPVVFVCLFGWWVGWFVLFIPLHMHSANGCQKKTKQTEKII